MCAGAVGVEDKAVLRDLFDLIGALPGPCAPLSYTGAAIALGPSCRQFGFCAQGDVHGAQHR